MATFAWRDQLATGHPQVDSQHKELFRLVNDLHDAIVAKRSREVMSSSLDALANYVVNHFRTEEAFMQAVHYPDYAVHKQQHDLLTKRAVEIISAYRHGTMTLSLTLSQFLADWITGHIEGHDLRMVKFVRERQHTQTTA